MTPSVTNRYRIHYGGLVLGGGEEYWIDGVAQKIEHRVGYDEAVISCSVVVALADTQATSVLEVLEDTLISTVREPNLRLRWLGDDGSGSFAQTIVDYDPAAGVNSGFLTRGDVEKIGDRVDTQRSRRWRVTWTVQLPATKSGHSGRRREQVDVELGPQQRRRVILTGEYTATSSGTALANYTGSIATWQTAVIAALAPGGRGFELVSETRGPIEAESQSDAAGAKVLSFRRELLERLADQATGGVADDPDLIDSELVVREIGVATAGATGTGLPAATPLRQIELTYGAWIAQNDQGGQPIVMRTKYTGAIRPFLLEQANTFSGGTTVLSREEVALNPETRRIEVSMSFVGVGTGRLLASRLTVSDSGRLAVTTLPVWDTDPYARHVLSGGAELQRTVTLTRTEARRFAHTMLTQRARAPALLPGATLLPQPTRGGWVFESFNREVAFGSLGSLHLTEVTEVHVYTWAGPVGTSRAQRQPSGGFVLPISGLGIASGASGSVTGITVGGGQTSGLGGFP